MKSDSFIATPIHTVIEEKYTYGYAPVNAGWAKRARKLRDRRWRALTNKVSESDNYSYFKPKHHIFR